MNLDQLLDESAPPVTARTPQLRHELRTLVLASEPVPRRRRTARLAVAGGIVAGVVGLGTVASAAGLLPGWTVLTASGQTCEIEVRADPLKPGDGEPIAATFTHTQQEDTLAAAGAFLESFDYDAIDRQDAVAAWQAAEEEVRAAQADPGERQPELAGDDLEVNAVTWVVVQRLRAALDAQGHDIRAISITTSNSGCEL